MISPKVLHRQQSTPVVVRLRSHEPDQTAWFRLSVLVPVYNERHLVETSLRRVLRLNHELIRELELIVVDDCSTDGSWEVLQRLAKEDARIRLLRHERNLGKGAAIRTAIAQASG